MNSDPVTPPTSTRGLAIADLCISRPVFATMINLFLVVLGWFSFRQIGIDQFPNVELPIVTVTTTLRGASAEEMETSVTKPLEEIINTVQGIDELSSTTIEGVSRITVQFFLERDRDIGYELPIVLQVLPEDDIDRHLHRNGCNEQGKIHEKEVTALLESTLAVAV